MQHAYAVGSGGVRITQYKHPKLTFQCWFTQKQDELL